MDGVIVNSEPIHKRAFLDVFKRIGFPDAHEIDFAAYYGRSDRSLWLDFIEKYHPPHAFDQLFKWKQDRFLEILLLEQPLFPEIKPLLARLSQYYPLGLASGSNYQVINEVLAMGGLRAYFSAVVSVQDVAQGKPAPDVFLRTAELLKIKPANCWVIEDAASGVDAALAAGMQVVAITNSLPAEKLRRANWIVNDYSEIEALLAKTTNVTPMT